jgi:hypothetical protein
MARQAHSERKIFMTYRFSLAFVFGSKPRCHFRRAAAFALLGFACQTKQPSAVRPEIVATSAKETSVATPAASGFGSGLGLTGGATLPADIKVPAGFKVELLYSAVPEKDGSWISLAVDNKGRLITSSQHSRGLFRLTLPTAAQPATPVKVEKLAVDVGHAHGLLYAFDSLYVVSADDEKERNGLYRLRDTDGDDQFDKTEFLKPLKGQGEHGPHGIVLSMGRRSIAAADHRSWRRETETITRWLGNAY